MDVQSDAADPPSSDSQPSGKKKGFKLFGKRKPGSIFSIRGRGEEKDHAAVARSKALEGSPESAASNPEQEPETENTSEAGVPGPNGQADGALQDEGILMMAASPTRPSICSTGSVRSLSFLLRLRGGRKGGRGERQVQTVSQPPPGRQRRGIKGLFSNVRFPQNKNYQEDKVGAPPSPLLMSSRSNSVEIIKEDMTLTPRPPRNHNSSSESDGFEAASRDYGSAVVPRTPVSLGPGTPPEPGDAGLSFLLADISSLLTFDSITTGGDIMADVAAEWDKASAAISARDTEETPVTATPSPKPGRSSPATYAPSVSAATSTRAPASAARLAVNPPRSFTATVKPTAASSLFTQPGAAEIKSSSLCGHPFKSPSAVAAASPAAIPSTFITVRSSAQKSTAMPSSSLVTLTSFSTPPVKTSTLITTKPPLYPTSTTDPTHTKPPAPVVAPPYGSPLTLSSMTVKPTAEATFSAATPAREPIHASPMPFSFTPVAYTLPSNLLFTPYDKLDSRNAPSYQSSSAKQPPYVLSSFTTGESKAPVLVTCPVQAKLPSSAPAVISKTTALPTSPLPPLPASSVTPAKPPCTPSLITADKYAPSFAAPSVASSFSSTPTPISSTKPPSIPAPVPPAIPIAPAVKPAAVPAHLDKMPSVPASTPLPTSQAAVPASTLSSTARPSAPAPTAPTLASKTPPLPLPPPFFTPTPLTPTPSSVSSTPAPMTCLPASKAPTSSSVNPSPITTPPSSVTRTPDPPVTKPAPAAPTPSPISPTPAPMSCTPASKPPIPASVIPTPITPTPSSVHRTPDAIVTKPAPTPPTPVSIPVSLPKTSPLTTTITPGPGRVQASVEPVPACLAGMNGKGAEKPSRREETVPATAESQRASAPGPIKDKRTPPGKLVGLSKIPVVGGGRVGKPPVRDIHPPLHGDDGDRSPDSSTPGPTPAPTPAPSPASTPAPTPAPTPAASPEDERPRLSPQDGKGRVGAGVPASRQPHHPEESQLAQHPQHPQPPRAITSSLRDSKIPVKHGAQPTSQHREPPRSKIPTSKVPVRRPGANKPAVASTTNPQMRK